MDGAHNRIRTGDLFLTKEVLYQLSYMGPGTTPGIGLFEGHPSCPRFDTCVFTSSLERVMGIEPTPSAWKAEVLPLNYTRRILRTPYVACPEHSCMVEGVGFEPTKAEPADLQSAPVDRLGTPPKR